MQRSLRSLFLFVLACCFAVGGPAFAQEKPKTLMELLFPRNNSEPKAKPAKPKPQTPKARNRTAAKRSGTGQDNAPASLISAPIVPLPEKSPTAKKILVIGDFLAAGTASGLTTTFEQSADVIVTDATNGSSGLVRDDFYNWPSQVATLITSQQPAIVVVMLGANDRQQLTVNGKREEVRSPLWLAEYRNRVGALARAITSRNIPLVWIGQVPFKSSAMTADMLALNDIFREAADNSKIGSSYIDVWEGFVDETGKFIERGPDINGQTVALRNGQINVTKAGYRKIAFYAERTLNRLLGDVVLEGKQLIEQAGFPPLSLNPQPVGPNLERNRPIDVLGTEMTTGNTLLGATVQPSKPAPLSPPALVPSGRIDDLKPKP